MNYWNRWATRFLIVALTACLALTVGCEEDNAETGSGNNGSSNSGSVAGTWAGGGISIVLVEESRGPDGLGGTKAEGSATLSNPRGSFWGVWVWTSGNNGIYVQGDGFGLSGPVSGKKWNATYIFPDDSIYTQITLTKQ